MGKLVVIDVESDGPLLGVNSMVCFGAVILDDKLDKTFYGQTSPISDKYNKEALSISGFSREEHERFQNPQPTFLQFREWLRVNNCLKSPILTKGNAEALLYLKSQGFKLFK